MVLSQYFLLTACPSLALISLHVSAGSSEIEPRGTTMKECHKKTKQNNNKKKKHLMAGHDNNFVSRESQCSLNETLRSEGNKLNCFFFFFPRGQS